MRATPLGFCLWIIVNEIPINLERNLELYELYLMVLTMQLVNRDNNSACLPVGFYKVYVYLFPEFLKLRRLDFL